MPGVAFHRQSLEPNGLREAVLSFLQKLGAEASRACAVLARSLRVFRIRPWCCLMTLDRFLTASSKTIHNLMKLDGFLMNSYVFLCFLDQTDAFMMFQEEYPSVPVVGDFVSRVLPDARTFPARRVVFFLGDSATCLLELVALRMPPTGVRRSRGCDFLGGREGELASPALQPRPLASNTYL